MKHKATTCFINLKSNAQCQPQGLSNTVTLTNCIKTTTKLVLRNKQWKIRHTVSILTDIFLNILHRCILEKWSETHHNINQKWLQCMINRICRARHVQAPLSSSHKHREKWRESHWHLTCSESVVWELGWPAFPYPWPWAVSSRPVRSTAALQFLLLYRRRRDTAHWNIHHDWLMNEIMSMMYHHTKIQSGP